MKTQRQRGFTIVELIVAIAISAILVGGLTTVTVSLQQLTAKGRDVVVANAFAERKVESLRSAGFLSLNDGSTDISGELPTELKSPRDGTLDISTESSGLKQVDITISYNDRGAQRTYLYTTYVGELGVGQD